MSDAPDCTAFHALLELFLAPRKQLHQSSRVQSMADGEIRRLRFLRKAVPGADKLAVITAVNPIAHHWPQFLGNVTLVFNGQIGNAAPCVQLIGTNDGARRANIDASAASAAMFRLG